MPSELAGLEVLAFRGWSGRRAPAAFSLAPRGARGPGREEIAEREERGAVGGDVGAEGKELQMYIEGDFYGSGSAFRLRHAYGKYGGLLAGQTWTNFLDPDNFHNTIDFESPMAFPSFRQAQVRYTEENDPDLRRNARDR